MFKFKNKLALTITLLLSFVSVQLFAQESAPMAPQPQSVWCNPMFLFLLLVNIILLLFIVVLANLYRQAALMYFKKIKENLSSLKTIAIIIGLFLVSNQLIAQDANAAAPIADYAIEGLNKSAFYLLLSGIVFQLFIILFLFKGIRNYIQNQATEFVTPSFLDQFNESVAIENEADIMFDHEYDGIRELDNNLPPWWKYGFYLTIVVAVVYLFVYHVSKTADYKMLNTKKN